MSSSSNWLIDFGGTRCESLECDELPALGRETLLLLAEGAWG